MTGDTWRGLPADGPGWLDPPAPEAQQADVDAFDEWLGSNKALFGRAAVELVAPVAAAAPAAVKREAAIRVHGWLRDVDPARTSSERTSSDDASGLSLTDKAMVRPSMQGALRGSGALALLARWTVRRMV